MVREEASYTLFLEDRERKEGWNHSAGQRDTRLAGCLHATPPCVAVEISGLTGGQARSRGGDPGVTLMEDPSVLDHRSH